MSELLSIVVLFGAVIGGGWLLDTRRTRRRAHFIAEYPFPSRLATRIREHHPNLDLDDVETVVTGLRQWFLACLRARGSPLGMPSRVVDDAWHEFILMTRDYHRFCDEAFGRYLNHTPNAVADKPTPEAIPKTFELLEREGVETIGGMPLLFAADEELRVARGRTWRRSTVLVAGASGTGLADCSCGDGCGGDGCGGDGCGGCCG